MNEPVVTAPAAIGVKPTYSGVDGLAPNTVDMAGVSIAHPLGRSCSVVGVPVHEVSLAAYAA